MLSVRGIFLHRFRQFVISRAPILHDHSGIKKDLGPAKDFSEDLQNLVTVPGGGLEKLQGAKEEVFFCEHEKDLLCKLGDKPKKPESKMDEDFVDLLEEEKEKAQTHDVVFKAKDVLEDFYFYKESQENFQELKKEKEKVASKEHKNE